jgi:hypothetical protein
MTPLFGKFLSLADKLDAEALRIRRRVPSASATSQHSMRAEAAALERAARAIRDQAVEAMADEPAASAVETLKDAAA